MIACRSICRVLPSRINQCQNYAIFIWKYYVDSIQYMSYRALPSTAYGNNNGSPSDGKLDNQTSEETPLLNGPTACHKAYAAQLCWRIARNQPAYVILRDSEFILLQRLFASNVLPINKGAAAQNSLAAYIS